MSDAAPLVLLTRSRDDNERTAPVFVARGLRTESMPGIEIGDPDDWRPVDEAIGGLTAYDGFLFTSRNSVERFLARAATLRGDAGEVMASAVIAAVGDRTAEALDAAGLPVTVQPDLASAEDLGEAMSGLGVEGKSFLFPKSSIAREVLPDALRGLGCRIDEVVVYTNVPPERASLDGVRSRLVDGSIRAVAFFSPSAVRNVVQLLGAHALANAPAAAIGRTTASALAGLGITAAITAGEQTAEGLADAIAQHFGL